MTCWLNKGTYTQALWQCVDGCSTWFFNMVNQQEMLIWVMCNGTDACLFDIGVQLAAKSRWHVGPTLQVMAATFC